MSDKTTIAAVAGGSAVVLAVAIAVTTGTENESKLDALPSSCAFMLGKGGSFVVPDDSGRCDLLYPQGRQMRCHLAPVSDVDYQWSYSSTPLGLVVRGLKQGAAVGFECVGAG